MKRQRPNGASVYIGPPPSVGAYSAPLPLPGGGGGAGAGFAAAAAAATAAAAPPSAAAPAPESNGDGPGGASPPAALASASESLAAAAALVPATAEELALAAAEAEEWNNLHRWGSMTRTIAGYRRIEQIGEGTYGQVYRAQSLASGRDVALKKIRVQHGGYYGIPPTVIREIKILKALHHPNMVEMVEVVSSKGVEDLDEDDEREDERRKKRKAERERERQAGGTGSGGVGDGNGGDNGSKLGASKGSAATGGKKSKKDRAVDAREGYKGNLFLVLEYVSHDLTGLMDMAYKFTDVQVKCIFRQLLDVLGYMHDQKYVHRDIKSSNILIDSHFRVKLADFGLARCIAPPILENPSDEQGLMGNRDLTNKVITLWYRPPELLLGESRYGASVDIWSAGCILAELILGRPLFTGKTEMEQLGLVFDMVGSPTNQNWEGFRDLKLIRTGEVTVDANRKTGRLRSRYVDRMSPTALNLIEKLLELDPNKRLTARGALTSRYFLSEPRAPADPADLGRIDLGDADDGSGNFHEFQTKKRRREAKAVAEKAKEAAKRSGLDEKDAYDAAYKDHMQKAAAEASEKKALEAAERKEEDQRAQRKREEESARRKARAAREKEKERESKSKEDKRQTQHDVDDWKRSRSGDKRDGREHDRDRDRDRDRTSRAGSKRNDHERGRHKRRDDDRDFGTEDRDRDRKRHRSRDDRDKRKDRDRDHDPDRHGYHDRRHRKNRESEVRDVDRSAEEGRNGATASAGPEPRSRESRGPNGPYWPSQSSRKDERRRPSEDTRGGRNHGLYGRGGTPGNPREQDRHDFDGRRREDHRYSQSSSVPQQHQHRRDNRDRFDERRRRAEGEWNRPRQQNDRDRDRNGEDRRR